MIDGADRSRRRRPAAVLCLLALGGLTAGAVAHVAVSAKHYQVALDIGRARRTSLDLQEKKRQLEIEIQMLKDPGRVVRLARDMLHMGPPGAAPVAWRAPNARPDSAPSGAHDPPGKETD